MKTTRTLLNLAFAAAALPTLAATAEKLPTVVVMHRNIHNAADERNWSELAQGISYNGYRVVSVAMERDEPATTASARVIDLLNRSGYNERLLLVGTAAASDAISAIAEAEPTQVEALVYVSAGESVPTFGPRSVSAPASLLGVVPSFQVKVTRDKRLDVASEGGQTVLKVREEGHSTLGRTVDMVEMIDRVNSLSKKA